MKRLENWHKSAISKLDAVGVGSSSLDALILLEDELALSRAHLFAHPEIELTASQIKNLNAKLARRMRHEPMAYIRGFSEFYGRKFTVNKDVLEPRPESETMIEILLNLKLPAKLVFVDIGTGSGAIAITAKLEVKKAQVYATEIDRSALAAAKQNAKKLKADVKFLQGDLLLPLKARSWQEETAVILANLPYVPDGWTINKAAAMEPKIAIFGGPDGMDLYRRMFEQISNFDWKPKFVLTESLPPQHKKLSGIALKARYRQTAVQDFIQVFEVI